MSLARRIVGIATLLLAAGSPRAGDLDGVLAKAVVRVRAMQIFIDAQGELHPLSEPVVSQIALEIQGDGQGGGWIGGIKLGGKNGGAELEYDLQYTPAKQGAHHIVLKRTMVRDGKKVDLPELVHDLDPLSSWTPTLVEDAGNGGRVVLKVTPEIEQASDDVTLDSCEIKFWMRRAIVIDLGKPGKPEERREPKVVFTNINSWGAGLSMGIPGLGVLKVGVRPFGGAKPCGWVRGHTMTFELGGRKYQGMSDTLILPEDPSRPGKGWTLYGVVDPDPKREILSYESLPELERP